MTCLGPISRSDDASMAWSQLSARLLAGVLASYLASN